MRLLSENLLADPMTANYVIQGTKPSEIKLKMDGAEITVTSEDSHSFDVKYTADKTTTDAHVFNPSVAFSIIRMLVDYTKILHKEDNA